MTETQKQICLKLGGVNYLPGTFDKRFGQRLAQMAQDPSIQELSDRQDEWMYRLLYKYRAQLPHTYEKFKHHKHCAKLA